MYRSSFLLSCFDMCWCRKVGLFLVLFFVPVSFALFIATHCGYRGGNHKYLHDADVSIDELETHLVV